MSKILLTGGAGTIGRKLFQVLKQQGHEVYSVDIMHSEDQRGFSLRSDTKHPTYARADIGEFRQIERVFLEMGPFDYVYNLAAEFGRWNGEDYYENLWRSNAVGCKNIIRLQERLGFRLIHFSSSEVYGDWPNIMVETVMDEYEIKQMNDYAMTKWVNEMQIRNSAIQYGTESVIVRIFNTYGPGEYYSPYRSVNCRFIYCALHNLNWVVFRGFGRTSTYLDDSVATLSNICTNFKPGEVYNIGGGEYHTIEELSDLVIKHTGADPSLAIYKESEILTTKIKKVDTSKAEHDLGHKNSVSLDEGVRITVDWMRRAYNPEYR